MEQTKLGSVKISGAGTIAGGRYDTVHISGSGQAQGAIEANEIHISGSGKFAGDVQAVTIKSSGSININGDVTAETVKVSGSLHIHGDLNTGLLNVPGSSSIDGEVKTREFHTSGSTKVQGNVRAEDMHLSGSGHFYANVEAAHFQAVCGLTIDGLLNSDTADIVLVGNAKIREIGGERITVLHHGGHQGTEGWELRSHAHTLTTETIEGDDIYLEASIAGIVRGRRVVIGQYCQIKTVEFSESLQIDPTATVEQQTFTGVEPAPEVARQRTEPPEGWAKQQAQQMSFTNGFNIGKLANPVVGILVAAAAVIFAFVVVGLVLSIIVPIIGVVLAGVALLLLIIFLTLPILLLIRLKRR